MKIIHSEEHLGCLTAAEGPKMSNERLEEIQAKIRSVQ